MAHTTIFIGAAVIALMMQATTDRSQTNFSPDMQFAAANGFSGDITFKAEGVFDTAPQWTRRPTREAIGRVFPAAAMRRGGDGSADLRCTLTVDGAVTGCVVTKERAVGLGFGVAAKTLIPDLHFRPALRGGKAVETPIVLSFQFVGPEKATGSLIAGQTARPAQQKMINAAAWTQAPSYAEVLAAYPAAAKAAGKGGRASLLCTFNAEGGFRSCTVESESPAGFGFGRSARQLANTFRAPATLPSGAPVAGYAIKIPFTFSERMLTGQPTGEPAMAKIPSNQEFIAAFPAEGRNAAVVSSDVLLDCEVASGGILSACTVAREAPTGLGFGEAALALVPKFQVHQWSEEGLPVVGGRVRVPVKYQLKAAS